MMVVGWLGEGGGALVVVMHVISFDFVDIICVQKKICLQTKSIVG